jgi:hypothetical protein
MSRRAASVLAWSLLGLYGAVGAADLWLVWREGVNSDAIFGLMVVGFAVVGGLVATHRPDNAVGWLLLVIALAFATQVFGESYVESPSNPGRVAVGWLAGWLWFVWLVLAGIFVPLLFPGGRLLSRRWRLAGWLGAGGLAASIAGAAFKPGNLALNTPVRNPLAADGTAAEVVAVIETLGGVLLAGAFLLTALSLAVRFHRARGVERQQLKWFAFVGLLMLGGLGLAALADQFTDSWAEFLGGMGWLTFLFGLVVGIPAATGISILRHRLYDIDVVINRTLVYGSLSVVLAATYLGVVLVLRLVLSPVTGESDLAVAGSTLAVAALVRPLRSRIQGAVDRRFYRARYDASRTLEAFTGRLREQIDLETLGTDLRTVVQDTVKPVHVSLWLREVGR